MICQTISQYRILEKLGEGGMGVVYRARDTQLDRDVALKFLPAGALADEESRVRFRREAKATAQLSHPNIATVFGIGETEDGRSYIAMEFVEGRTLSEMVKEGPLELEAALDIGAQIVAGLHSAHEKRIVHRDVKSTNIMVDRTGRARLVDFGLARLAESTQITREASTVGTAAYMSPEQARGEEVDHRADVWALGVVLYEMIAGRRPFCSDYEQALVYAILNTHPEPLTTIRAGVPRALERIVAKCLEKTPAKRYQHIEEVGVDLASVKAALHDEADIVNPEFNRPKPRRQRVLRRIGLASLGLAILAVAGGLWLVPTVSAWLARSSSPIRSIAVIPRGCQAEGVEAAFLCDVFSEQLIAGLSQIGSLTVKSLGAVEPYKESNQSVMDIGRQLRVDAIVTATIQARNPVLRLGVEVTDVRNGAYLWSGNVESNSATRDDGSRAFALDVADKLHLLISSAERAKLQVFNIYQQALAQWDKRTAESLTEAITLFRRVIEEDPEFARAYAGLASSFVLLPYYGGLPPSEAYPEARKAAEQALALNERLAEAHAALGLVSRDYERDWAGAEREFRRALQLDPESTSAQQWYAEYLAALGRFEEAELNILQAERSSRVSLTSRAVHGWILLCAGQLDAGLAQLEATREMGPEFPLTHWFIGQLQVRRGRYEEAVEALTKATELSRGNTRMLADLGSAYALLGRKADARAILDRLRRIADQGNHVPRFEYAIVLAGLGERDEAFRELEAALEERTWHMAMITIDPMLDPLRDDPRFEGLVSSVGLPKF